MNKVPGQSLRPKCAVPRRSNVALGCAVGETPGNPTPPTDGSHSLSCSPPPYDGLSRQSHLGLELVVHGMNLTRALPLGLDRIIMHTAPAIGISQDLTGVTQAPMLEVVVTMGALAMAAAIDGRTTQP